MNMFKSVLVFIVVIGSCFVCDARQKPRRFVQMKALADELYLRSDYISCIRVCDDILKRFHFLKPESVYYLKGLSFLQKQDTDNAKAEFNKLLGITSDKNLIKQIKLALIDCDFVAGKYMEASLGYEEFIQENPNLDNIPTVKFKLARCFQYISRWEDSRRILKGLIENYPLSPEAAMAEEILRTEVPYFRVQVGAYSKRSSADGLVRDLSKKAIQAEIVEAEKNRKPLFKVRAGKFQTRAEAKDFAEKLRQMGFQTFVIP
ncbi:hypothetical protein B9J78_01545 [bacterium Unc6]|nr:hypothetical protein [bacterium Unc6]